MGSGDGLFVRFGGIELKAQVETPTIVAEKCESCFP
jgi:hypothetical protein